MVVLKKKIKEIKFDKEPSKWVEIQSCRVPGRRTILKNWCI